LSTNLWRKQKVHAMQAGDTREAPPYTNAREEARRQRATCAPSPSRTTSWSVHARASPLSPGPLFLRLVWMITKRPRHGRLLLRFRLFLSGPSRGRPLWTPSRENGPPGRRAHLRADEKATDQVGWSALFSEFLGIELVACGSGLTTTLQASVEALRFQSTVHPWGMFF
jgi:hypothetical protein